ncbi:MAG: hypothetical protein ABUR63_09200 [Verrucomicrobiota bacterium]
MTGATDRSESTARAWPSPPPRVTARVLIAAPMCMVWLVLLAPGCLGARFHTADPATQPALDAPSRAVADRVNADRKTAHLTDATLMPDLRPPVVRAALAVARGEKSLKSGAHAAAQDGVTEVGRHVWTFAAECTDLQRFRPPPLVLQQKALLLAVAAVPVVPAVPGGRTVVVIAIAEPGASALRADQMGGGPGGTNPNVETYAHPSVASGPCGETWPATQRAAF